MNENNPVSVYLSTIGTKGGKASNPLKRAAVMKNLAKANAAREANKKSKLPKAA